MVLRSSRLFAAAAAAFIVGLPFTASAVGLEVNARVGYGSAGDDSPVRYEPTGLLRLPQTDPIYAGTAKPYGGGLILQGGLGLRTGQFVSVGLGGGIRSASASSVDGASDVSRSAWNAGPYVRVYLPFVPIVDPYVGLGVEYVSDTQKYKAPVATTAGTMTADWTLEHHGVAVPLTLGVDYTIAKIFSIGPSFQYSLVFPAGACANVKGANISGSSHCASEAENKRITTGQGYGVWSLALSLRVTFPPQ
jgi:hypothetical protein